MIRSFDLISGVLTITLDQVDPEKIARLDLTPLIEVKLDLVQPEVTMKASILYQLVDCTCCMFDLFCRCSSFQRLRWTLGATLCTILCANGLRGSVV